MGLVTTTSIKNVFRMKTVLIILVPIALICVVGVDILMCLLVIAPESASATPDMVALEGYLSLILYASSFISIGVTLNSLVFQTMTKEKSRGNYAALLATPLKATDIWMGKSLALFLPGLVLGVLLTALSLVLINIIYFLPKIGFLFSLQMLISSLVAVPLIYLLFGMLVHLVSFISKPATGNIIAQIFLPVMANVVMQLVVRNVMDANSWTFLALNLGIALVIGIIVLMVKPRLTPEKIMLSG
jgi:hypothetical protein